MFRLPWRSSPEFQIPFFLLCRGQEAFRRFRRLCEQLGAAYKTGRIPGAGNTRLRLVCQGDHTHSYCYLAEYLHRAAVRIPFVCLFFNTTEYLHRRPKASSIFPLYHTVNLSLFSTTSEDTTSFLFAPSFSLTLSCLCTHYTSSLPHAPRHAHPGFNFFNKRWLVGSVLGTIPFNLYTKKVDLS